MIVFLIKMTVAKIDSGRKFHTLHVFLAELRYKFVSQPFPVFGRETDYQMSHLILYLGRTVCPLEIEGSNHSPV